ncbi:MAG: hypothetical protein MZV64_04845 [Ignavibacteriales bacterium]|nr:hypothetical protein [Ignavibacteriales bacterium]
MAMAITSRSCRSRHRVARRQVLLDVGAEDRLQLVGVVGLEPVQQGLRGLVRGGEASSGRASGAGAHAGSRNSIRPRTAGRMR